MRAECELLLHEGKAGITLKGQHKQTIVMEYGTQNRKRSVNMSVRDKLSDMH